jgi:enoyl-CoA hydratase/carnithine racemase
MPDHSHFNTNRTYPGRWTVTFSNPPINMFVPSTIVELGTLMTDLDADPSVKAVVFQSANPDFFIAHLDVAKAAERPEMLGLWRTCRAWAQSGHTTTRPSIRTMRRREKLKIVEGKMVDGTRLELVASALRTRRSPN